MTNLQKAIKRNGLNIVFILPLVIFIVGFTVVPIIQTILLSFKDPYDTAQWSLASYEYMFSKSHFVESVVNTLWIAALGLFIQIGMGFLIALLLKQTFVGKGLARAFVLLPMGVPTLVSGVAMLHIFSTSGYLNELLFRLNMINVPVDWTGSKALSMLIVAIADSWKVMPIVVMLFLSGLESISNVLYEASSIDGATSWQNFRYITLPQLKSTCTMTILLRMVDLLRIFEMPQVLLGRSTPFLGTLAYSEYEYGNATYSAVVSTILLVLIIASVVLYMLLFNRERRSTDGYK